MNIIENMSYHLKLSTEEELTKQNGMSTSIFFLRSSTASCGWHGSYRSRFLSSASYVFVSREWRRGKSVWATCPRHVARHVTGFLPLSTWTGWGRTVGERKGRRAEDLRRRRFSRVSESTRIFPATVPRGPRDRWLPLKSQTRSTLQEACSPSSPTLHGERLPRVTCGCRKSGDLPAGSCSQGRYPGNKFERGRAFAELNATRWLR